MGHAPEDGQDGGVALAAPDGTPIRATYDAIVGAEEGVTGVVRVKAGVEVEGGAGTDTDTVWNNQRTVLFRGRKVFVDDRGALWHEGQLVPEGAEPAGTAPLTLPDYNGLLGLVHRIHDVARSGDGGLAAVLAAVEEASVSV